jgi:ABC-type xylose transport system permease subunit
MVFVIISAEIDLSVGSMMGLLGGVAAIFDVWLGWPLPLTVAVTLVLGLVLGAGTAGGLPTAKSRRLSSPWRGCWPSAGS